MSYIFLISSSYFLLTYLYLITQNKLSSVAVCRKQLRITSSLMTSKMKQFFVIIFIDKKNYTKTDHSHDLITIDHFLFLFEILHLNGKDPKDRLYKIRPEYLVVKFKTL